MISVCPMHLLDPLLPCVVLEHCLGPERSERPEHCSGSERAERSECREYREYIYNINIYNYLEESDNLSTKHNN